ncbi:hypothetical protein H8356DRAFT_1043677 [Neocallimastix lanati (nom. inval.)]|uniref:Uncharacterized protein n=1 Tax=Neocallimastix californiae TaxID=1754190 RepID=A0A1Y2BY71_9FUNG|nr:hypothetical protein H8356DRAFT_1043677 [Neocallimastix sp. JGI-2020a]ORY39722.1 hypothetical protein LY90DRAFT_510654 [Neocallimastix californiae]|eukprot:ORY39722.1 hypothetical protein LY90DRAFT_510654 [Neocallimastix californiae]
MSVTTPKTIITSTSTSATTTTTLYESKISLAKWMVYDVIGNIGWILYLVFLGLSFVKKPEFMNSDVMLMIMWVSILPGLLIVMGVVELISERIVGLDYILPKVNLYRGFGALTLAGILGFFITLSGVIYGIMFIPTNTNLLYVWLMFIGSILLGIFAGLLFKEYKKIKK